MIRMTRRFEFRMPICPSVYASDNLSKISDIFTKIGTHVPWHSERDIIDGRKWTIAMPI